jgi:ubiquinone/menaquinone biosynthesis C-methylase UbiE
MPDFKQALREFFRTLKPGGKLGITDVSASGPLPPELEEILLQLLCISHRITTIANVDTIEREEFESVEISDESKSLLELVETIKKRLLLAELLAGVKRLSLGTDKLDKAKRLIALAKAAVENGNLRYVMLVAKKPVT